ncbi:tRNA-specific 2-thiouridylase [Candidatus Azambacteria bacterium]|nr:tRNA-specific 2-thiouridylase [Candidatus Azambacteria bacterium]
MNKSNHRLSIKPRVFVAISGGVDSSVAAALLKKQGYDVTGVFMKNWTDNRFNCPYKEDRESAMRVAAVLDIPFYTWNFEAEYKKEVVDYMIKGYRSGITPNPDVMCNQKIKFNLFLKRAIKEGADYIATGHYVKNQKSKIKNQNDKLKLKNDKVISIRQLAERDLKFQDTYQLFQAEDETKDQSYFLWTLNQKQLKYCLFPIGDYLKTDVRKMAKKIGLLTANRPDSQGICFIGKVKLKDFLSNYIPKRSGDILSIEGEKLGTHEGAWFYTIGQRQGLGISGGPYFVVSKDIKKNRIYVTKDKFSSELMTKKILVHKINWINQSISKNIRAMIRYGGEIVDCSIKEIKNKKIEVTFKKSQWAVAVGQSIVFYSKTGEMLGGGVVT